MISRIHLILPNAYKLMCFDRNINGNRDVKFLECDKWSLHSYKNLTLLLLGPFYYIQTTFLYFFAHECILQFNYTNSLIHEHNFSKNYHSSFNKCYENEILSLTRISLCVVLTCISNGKFTIFFKKKK